MGGGIDAYAYMALKEDSNFAKGEQRLLQLDLACVTVGGNESEINFSKLLVKITHVSSDSVTVYTGWNACT